MGTIKEEAMDYKPQKLKNISELKEVSVDLVIEDKTYGEGDSAWSAKITNIEGEEYQVKSSVLKSLKAILEVKPDLKKFRVVKSGEGMDTSYTVIPVE